MPGNFVVSKSGGETVRAFVPAPLPPDPALQPGGEIPKLLQTAMLSLGRLDGLSEFSLSPLLRILNEGLEPL